MVPEDPRNCAARAGAGLTGPVSDHPTPGDPNLPLEPWQLLESRELYASEPWVRITLEKVRLPDGRVVDDYHRIELVDFVIVYAETAHGEVVLERQYKHGPREIVLSLPAGAIDAGEAPLAAASRELLEETGYSSAEWHALGSFTMSGNYGCGRAHIFLARRSERTAEPMSDDLEQTQVLLYSHARLQDALANGRIGLLGNAAAIMLAHAKLEELR